MIQNPLFQYGIAALFVLGIVIAIGLVIMLFDDGKE